MSFWDDITGKTASNAANAAAADTYAKQTAAAGGLQSYGNTLPALYNQIYQPYSNAGGQALDFLKGGLGLGGPVSAQTVTNAYQSTPGYTEGLNTGLQAAERGLNAGGGPGLDSGAALKALYRYGSDYNNQKFGDYLGRLGGLVNTGLAGASGQAAGLGANTGVQTNAANMLYGAAPTIGQGQVAGAQAEQNALGNLLKTGANLAGAVIGGPIGSGLGSAFGNMWQSPSFGQQAFWNQGNVGPL